MLKKYFLTLAVICLPHLIITDNQKNLVKSRYPQAYTWYRDLATKYPKANLFSIDFCISDYHHSDSNAIFWPECNLKIIDQYYDSSFIAPEIQQLMLEDEYLLLHEACHALKNHVAKGGISLAAATTASTSLAIGLATAAYTETISTVVAIAYGATGSITAAASIFAYARTQEQEADEFANQNADQLALQAGIKWHQKNHKELQIPDNASAIQQTYIEITSDIAHPAPQERLNNAQQALNNRFNSQSLPAST